MINTRVLLLHTYMTLTDFGNPGWAGFGVIAPQDLKKYLVFQYFRFENT